MDLVPENFIDAFGEISFKHGVIRIELVSLSGPEPRVSQRLITSLQAFRQMLQAQSGMLQQLEKAGVIRSAEPAQAPPEPNPSSECSGVVAAVGRVAHIQPVSQSSAGSPGEAGSRVASKPAQPRSPNFSEG